VGLEPTRISPTDLKTVSLTTRTSSLKDRVHQNCHNSFLFCCKNPSLVPTFFGATRIRTEVTGFKAPGPDHLDYSTNPVHRLPLGLPIHITSILSSLQTLSTLTEGFSLVKSE
jgi:hypothetical protein